MAEQTHSNRHRTPRIRRRWPSAAVVLGVFACGLVLWRVITFAGQAELPPAGVPIRVVRAVDGDTLLLEGGARVRLLGVNTPETKHPNRPAEPFGEEASQWTASAIERGPVTLEYDRERHDQYRRVLAYVHLSDGTLLNESLIQQGLSPAVVSFPIRSDRRRLFIGAEEDAQAARRGIWSLPQWQERIKHQRATARRE